MADSFEKIWEFLVKINSFAGLFTFKENLVKSRKQRCLKWFCRLNAVCLLIMPINTILMFRNDLMYFIISATFLLTIIFTWFSCFTLLHNQETVLEIIDWCRNIYNLDQYHMLVIPKAWSQLDYTKKFCYKAVKVIFFLFNFDGFLVTIGLAIVFQLKPGEAFGKYQPPLPFYLPFVKQNNWATYAITLFLQTFGLNTLCQHFIYLVAIITTISIHLLRYLDLIYETVTQMNLFVIRNGSNINGEFETMELRRWIKRVCDMNCNFKK